MQTAVPSAESTPPPEIPAGAMEVCEAAARAAGRVLLDWIGRFGVSHKGPRDLVTEADVAAQREILRIVAEAFPGHGFIGEESLPERGAATAGAGRPSDEPVLRWIVDPLDGTSNYVHGFPAWCVSIALSRGDELLVAAVHDPLRDECFTAALGGGSRLNGRPIAVSRATVLADALVAVSFPPHVTPESPAVADFLAVVADAHSVRRSGSTALNLAWLASGRLDAFWVRRIACWDVAAGLLLCREAGGVVGGFGANPTARVRLQEPAFVAACTPELLAALQTRLP